MTGLALCLTGWFRHVRMLAYVGVDAVLGHTTSNTPISYLLPIHMKQLFTAA